MQSQPTNEQADRHRPGSTVRRVSSMPTQPPPSTSSTQQAPPTVLQSKAQRQPTTHPPPFASPRMDPASHRPKRVAHQEFLLPDSGFPPHALDSADVYYDSIMHSSTGQPRAVGNECSTSQQEQWQQADEAASVPQLLARAASAGADWKVQCHWVPTLLKSFVCLLALFTASFHRRYDVRQCCD